jgi:hypothetical protein
MHHERHSEERMQGLVVKTSNKGNDDETWAVDDSIKIGRKEIYYKIDSIGSVKGSMRRYSEQTSI